LIRAATHDDLNELAVLHRASIMALCTEHYSQEQLREWTSGLRAERYAPLLESHVVILDERAGKLCGLGVFDPRAGLINATYVAPVVVRQGVGRALIEAMEQIASERGVHEVHLNATLNAVPFYESLGYANDGPAINRLPSGAELPCLRMRKVLPAF
jgi:GNAT superfamily N-acetyltransferase